MIARATAAALLLAAGNFIRVLFQQFRNAEPSRDGFEPHGEFLLRNARQYERQIDIVLDRERVEQIEFLKYEAQMVAAEGRTVGFFDRGKILAVQQDRAGGRLVKPGQNV